jgi:quinoprotein glucose dehydrogenase
VGRRGQHRLGFARIAGYVVRLFLFSLYSAAGAAPGAASDRGNDARASVAAGETLYRRHCAACHGAQRTGGEAGPALIGSAFRARWLDAPGADLGETIRTTMPPQAAGRLSDTEYAAILAFLSDENGHPSEEAPAVAGTAAKPAAGIMREWLHHRGSPGSTNYSPLDLIDGENVHRLHVVWRWSSRNFGSTPEFNFQATPLMANGVLYTTGGSRRAVVAIDAVTGETLWMWRLDEGERGENAPRRGAGRGVAYRRDGSGEYVYVITPGYRLVALYAKTGRQVRGLGEGGIVDLMRDFDQDVDLVNDPVGASSPPIVVNGVVIVGSAFAASFAPRSKAMIKGHVRGYDAQTGKRLWTFHSIPGDGEYGNDTWDDDAWRYTGNAGAWAPISADPELNYVYVPMEAATGDLYGGHRPGDNLFSQSLVCLDAATGERVWHFQTVHHGIWDYDLPAPPVVLDIDVRGRVIPAVAQVTKQGFTFVFDRRSGEPVWPIEERPVPQSDVPGERTAPTQPFPTRPAPFERQGVTLDDLNDLTPEILAEAKRLVKRHRLGPLYSPPSAVSATNDGTLIAPFSSGGANWQGGVADPETGMLYVASTATIGNLALETDAASEMRYVRANRQAPRPFGLSLGKPPWGRITAIDLNTGEHVWTIANGDTPAYVREHEKLAGRDLPRTGHNERAGLLVTRSLLFAGEGSGLYVADEGGRMLRAHDKATGEILFEMELPARQSGIPMTYAVDGRQYIVVAAGAPETPGELVALGVH